MSCLEAKRSTSYNCADFFVDACREFLSLSLDSFLPDGEFNQELFTKLRRTDKARHGDVVFMRDKNEGSHIGLFYEGKVLHLGEYFVEYQPIEVATRGYKEVRFYRWIQDSP